MGVDSKDYNVVPPARDWLATVIEYEGRGRAEFSDPVGVLEGQVKVRFDEFGDSSIEMEVDSIGTDELHPGFGLIGFLSGISARGFRGGSGNPCGRLTVTAEQGVFSSWENIFYGFSADISSKNRGQLSFQLQSSQFDAAEGGVPKYWTIPLCNFLSAFRQRHQELDRPPLRIFPTPIVPGGLSEREAMIAEHVANQRNRLIVFEFNKSLGFIEPVADFDERKTRLLEGRERNTITAVMVGEVGANSTDFADLERWFPSDFLLLLGFASGIEVGAPWIEFRDENGLLVRRIHAKFWRSLFSRGHEVINELFHCGEKSGTGYLLSIAPTSDDYASPHLRIVLQHIIRGGLAGYTIQDKLDHLFRALDILCEHYDLKKIQTPNQTLENESRGKLKKVFKDATKAINNIANEADKSGKDGEAKVLRRISQQLRRAMNIETGFGKAVISLLNKVGLPDADIAAAGYARKPRPDERSWSEVLSYYRGLTIHRGYFQDDHDTDDIWTIYCHVHDMLVRIVFRILGYEGNYQPTVIHASASEPVDWLSSGSADSLGY